MCVCVAAWPGLAWPSRGAKGRLPDFVSSFSAAALIKIITRVFFLFAFSVASALPLALALFLLPESRKFEAFYGRVSFRVCTLAQRPHCPGLCPPPPLSHSSSGPCRRPFSSRALFPLAMWMVSLLDRHRPIAI